MITYEIIEYKETFAEKVAHMWNESREGWGGDQEVETEEERRQAEATNGNILTLLAYDGEDVIGYCGFSEFKGDEGALYIPLLNVHPNHHGKGIGKKLVLEALKRTTELGWPRLDLYTWPGNTKAVPLYKRCGFFWEERDDRVHLLNFIPKIITHPVLSQYIDDSNWYDSLKREISIKPDGDKENGFTYYSYHFETEKGVVHARIEQSGRGISSFSTEQYEVEWTLPSQQLLLSGQYEGHVHIRNKQTAALKVNGKLVDHPYIEGSLVMNEKVKDTLNVKVPFTVVKAPDFEQSKWKTHPRLCIEMEIDGEEFELELGTVIQKPVKLEPFLMNTKNVKTGQRSEYYVRVKNQLEEKQTVHLKICGVETPYIVELSPAEKQVITVPFTVQSAGVMNIEIEVHATLDWLHSTYEEQVAVAVPSRNVSFVMETPIYLYVYHGSKLMRCSKEDHQTILMDAFTGERIPLVFLHPLLGKPYSHYLAKQTWTSYTFEQDTQGVSLKLSYGLEQPQCTINHMFTWTHDGQLASALEVTNTGSSALTDLYVGQLFYLDEERVILPLEESLLEADESVSLDLLPLDQISEPWLFIEGRSHTFALQWPEGATLYTPSWQALIEQQTEVIQPGASHLFEPLRIDIDVYANWQTFQQDMKPQALRKIIHLAFSKQHGFYVPGEELELELSQQSKQVTSGKVKMTDADDEQLKLEGVSNQRISQTLSLDAITSVDASILTGASKTSYSAKAIPIQETAVEQQITQEQGHDVWTVDNGVLTFKVAPGYFPSMYSLTTKKKEWLDHVFPTPGPKSWWNPWGGGIHIIPSEMNLYTLLKQTSTATFCARFDQWGHKWEGIQLDVDFTDHVEWKGMKLRQYFLTLPGSPIVATYYEVWHLDQLLVADVFRSVCFLNKEAGLLTYYPHDANDQWKLSGQEGTELSGSQLSSIIRVWDEKESEGLVIVPTDLYLDATVYSNAEAWTWSSNQTYTATPQTKYVRSHTTFFCVTDKHQSTSGWEWLKHLRFKEVDHESH
ncbi:GNAT family N-acetyltransferase [Alkalicoccobacillus murimartini]|uniref:GNAT superfamily N-acetyltransferase n=1 Tax=Alkalicoccobacillus murimartini TaxID=171685 RepID=A0ABT9YKD0_9BACI|nr:GNAT family N-acetyltransferase [Alkalicoccobacillus murimartini]MDQ0208315.1 GNAT superfamily N-acetyltransferase [Alkalicoccobacillus murimartini]